MSIQITFPRLECGFTFRAISLIVAQLRQWARPRGHAISRPNDFQPRHRAQAWWGSASPVSPMAACGDAISEAAAQHLRLIFPVSVGMRMWEEPCHMHGLSSYSVRHNQAGPGGSRAGNRLRKIKVHVQRHTAPPRSS